MRTIFSIHFPFFEGKILVLFYEIKYSYVVYFVLIFLVSRNVQKIFKIIFIAKSDLFQTTNGQDLTRNSIASR